MVLWWMMRVWIKAVTEGWRGGRDVCMRNLEGRINQSWPFIHWLWEQRFSNHLNDSQISGQDDWMGDRKRGGSFSFLLMFSWFSLERRKHKFTSECLGFDGLCGTSREKSVQDAIVMEIIRWPRFGWLGHRWVKKGLKAEPQEGPT